MPETLRPTQSPEQEEIERLRAIQKLQTAALEVSAEERAQQAQQAAAGSFLAGYRARKNKELEDKVANLEELEKRAKILVPELVRKGSKDAMTGLLQKESFFEVAEQMHKSLGTTDTVLMVDVDDFKKKNTRYGYLEADKALIAVAQSIKGDTRESDFYGRWNKDEDQTAAKAGRYGGEEFASVHPAASPHDIAKRKLSVNEKGHYVINCTVRLQVQETGEYEDVPLTVSGALVSWEPKETIKEALAKASKRLNEIKSSGKNRIEIVE